MAASWAAEALKGRGAPSQPPRSGCRPPRRAHAPSAASAAVSLRARRRRPSLVRSGLHGQRGLGGRVGRVGKGAMAIAARGSVRDGQRRQSGERGACMPCPRVYVRVGRAHPPRLLPPGWGLLLARGATRRRGACQTGMRAAHRRARAARATRPTRT
eukprot:933046-Prymnesium_polylepis.3